MTQLMMTQAQVFTNHLFAQANLGVGPQPNASTPTSRIKYLMRINPSTFHGPNVDEDPKDS